MAEGLRPGPSDEATDALLRDAEAQARGRAGPAGTPGSSRRVAAWRAAYQAFGAKPKRTRPSVEALLRRVRGAGCPGCDRLTDIYNAISVRHACLPAASDLAQVPRAGPGWPGRPGTSRSTPCATGSRSPGTPSHGEVIWRDDDGVTCRCWNWRQCVRTRITHDTTSAMFILDGLAELGAGRPGGRRAGTWPASWRRSIRAPGSAGADIGRSVHAARAADRRGNPDHPAAGWLTWPRNSGRPVVLSTIANRNGRSTTIVTAGGGRMAAAARMTTAVAAAASVPCSSTST